MNSSAPEYLEAQAAINRAQQFPGVLDSNGDATADAISRSLTGYPAWGIYINLVTATSAYERDDLPYAGYDRLGELRQRAGDVNRILDNLQSIAPPSAGVTSAGNVADVELIKQYYRTFLGREGDAAGVSFWVQSYQNNRAAKGDAAARAALDDAFTKAKAADYEAAYKLAHPTPTPAPTPAPSDAPSAGIFSEVGKLYSAHPILFLGGLAAVAFYFLSGE